MTPKIAVFDAYGTLFDVQSAARTLAASGQFPEFAGRWAQIAAFWREKQLSYTWLRAAGAQHVDFWQVTQDALDAVLEGEGLSDPALRAALLMLYRELDAYPEVPSMLRALKSAGMQTAILTNGSPDMINDAVRAANIGAYLDDILTVEQVGVYKPDAKVYALVEERFICRRSEVVFISSNGWDAAAASGYGFATVWVNRAGAPVERLWAKPAHELPDLSGLPELLGA